MADTQFQAVEQNGKTIGHIGGWIRERENESALKSLESQDAMMKVMASTPYKEISFDPRKVLKVENQKNQGACFPAGHKVSMADGTIKLIEDVEIGDEVITHHRRVRQVTNAMVRHYSKEMYTVFVKGWGKVTMTADHIVRVERNGQLEWVRADEMTLTDKMIVSPGIQRPLASICLSDYVGGDIHKVGSEVRAADSPAWIKDRIKIDSDFCWILGLYVAEGSTDRTETGTINRFCFSLHINETEYQNRIQAWAGSLGLTCQVELRPENNKCDVRINCPILAQFLDNVCGRFSNQKRIPHFIMKGNQEQRKSFLRGYLDGDGTYEKMKQGKNQVSSETVSRTLAQQLSQLQVTLGYKPGRTSTKRNDRQRSYATYLYSEDICDFMGVEYTNESTGGATKIANRRKMWCVEGQTRVIRSITTEKVDQLAVYDITVDEDHSFVCQGLVVHNCQGHALSSVAEFCCMLAGGDLKLALSRAMGYYETQRVDRIKGDKGSTIMGGVELLTNTGLCEESLWPYPSSYQPQRPSNFSEITANAGKRKLQNHIRLKSYDAIRTFLGSGQGAITLGISWGRDMAKKVVEKHATGSGGHAVGLFACSENKDLKGRPYIWMMNSWSEEFGQKGWSEWSPTAIDQMMKHSHSVFVGCSDMTTPAPRELSFNEVMDQLKI